MLGALILFSVMLPSLNETILYNDKTILTTSIELAAISVAERILAEAGTKEFDLACVGSSPTSASQLTSPFHLGPAYGEVYPNFNDLDDYNYLSVTDSTTFPSVPLNINARVYYVNPANPTQTVSYQTFLKKLEVSITSPWLENPASGQPFAITLEQIYAYY